jgi:dihydrodipicolinate synthase/N-acetylneuraminate lyase
VADLKGIDLATPTPMAAVGDHAVAMQLWSRMMPALLYIWRGNCIAKVKAACRLRGFDGGGVRAPLQNLDSGAEHELAKYLEPLDRG